MASKLPFDAFDHYLSLGPSRSYQAVAEKYGVSKRAVVDLAKKEQWQTQVAEIEAKARENTNQKAVETLEEMAERHLKVCRVIQHKALEALKAVPLTTAMGKLMGVSVAALRGSPMWIFPVSGSPGQAPVVSRARQNVYHPRPLGCARRAPQQSLDDERHTDASCGDARSAQGGVAAAILRGLPVRAGPGPDPEEGW